MMNISKPYFSQWSKSMNRTSVFQKVVFLVTCGVLLTACAAPVPIPTATPMPTSTTAPTATTLPTAIPTPRPFTPPAEGKIIFTKADGREISGTIHGHGKTAIILSDMIMIDVTQAGKDQWGPLIEALDKEKFTAVSYRRSVGDPAGVIEEINLVVQNLRDAGYQRMVCIGANFGIVPCSIISSAPEMIGAVLVGAPDHHYDTKTIFQNITNYPKLFIVGEKDGSQIDRVTKIYDQSSQPKNLMSLPAESGSGTELFSSPTNKDAFLKLLIDFVNSLS
jgi:hypothetical protein